MNAVDFYKHISQDLPEPRRMRQLLTWCATRALPPAGVTEAPEVQDMRIGKQLAVGTFFNSLADSLKHGPCSRSYCEISQTGLRCRIGLVGLVYSARCRHSFSNIKQEDSQTPPLVKKPNPRNVQNAAKLLELEKQVKRFVSRFDLSTASNSMLLKA